MYPRLIAALVLLSIIAGPATSEELSPQLSLQFSIAESSPGLSSQLATDERLFIRLAYQSDRPVRFRAEGYAAARKIIASARYSISPPYPAGKGEALVWVSFHRSTAIDEIRISAFDGTWKLLGSTNTPAALSWREGAPSQPIPSWASRLNREQQEMGGRENTQVVSVHSKILFGVALFSILGYPLLQVLLPIIFAGGWRLAALVPLLGTVPITIHAIHALNAGSNLWPIWLIFFASIAFLYLLIIAAAGWIAGRTRQV